MKKWSKPQLMVLQRRRPEEAVLATCKVALHANLDGADGGCQTVECADCVAAEPS